MSLILAATGVLMVIAVVLDLIMSWFEGQMRKSRGGSKKMWIPVAAIVLAFILLLPMAAAAPATFFSMTATTPKPS